MDINYQILFTIELLHEYFMDGKCNALEVIPAEDCKSLFKNINIQWRNTDNKFIALIRENDLHEPFINRPPEKLYRKFFDHSIFRIYLKINDLDFLNYTNTTTVSNNISYFNNLADNKIAILPPALPFLYLSQRISDHAIGQVYLPGDYATEPATDHVFETIKKHTSTDVAELADPALWLPKQMHQFPTVNEQITFTGSQFVFILPAAVTEAMMKIWGFNFDPDAPGFTEAIGETEIQKFDVPTSLIKIDLQNIPSGRYKLQVNDETMMVYYDPRLLEDNIFGVIEIFNHLPATNDYSFLDAIETIQRKNYTIQFPNRNVLWKYIRKDHKPQTITDTGMTNYVFNLNGDEFISDVPIPLTEAVLNTLKLEFSTADFDLSPLPNPSGKRLGKHNQDSYDYLCAEMYLNY